MFLKLLPILLACWPLAGVAAFRRLPGPLAVLVLTIVGTLFLPEVQGLQHNVDAAKPIEFPLIKLTKTNVISYALLVGSLFWDRRRWSQVNPRWFDFPMVAWCVAPLFASMTNDLGSYDGGAGVLARFVQWGIPYWMGRLYLGTREGMLAWAAAVVIGGLIYVPLCLLEVRLSPQLHRWFYGFYQHDFAQSIRDGSFRPTVFMEHGLTVAQWMAAATVSAWWLWSSGTFGRVTLVRWWRPVSLGVITALLAVTTLLTRSLGPSILGLAATAALAGARALRSPLPLFALMLVPPTYLALRITDTWSGQDLVDIVRANVSGERADSLQTRITQEQLLLAKARERLNFGWGGHGRWRISDDAGNDITISDSMWIIALCSEGLFGLTAVFVVVLLPPARFLCVYPPSKWVMPFDAGPPVAAAVLTVLAIDHLANATQNPILMLALGGLSGVTGIMAKTPFTTSSGQSAEATSPR